MRNRRTHKKKKAIVIIMGALLLLLLCGFTKDECKTVTFTYEGKTKNVMTYENEEGVTMYPLKEITEFYGYQCEECGRCGHDEVYMESDSKDERGHCYVHYYQNLVSYSVSSDLNELEAKTERLDGVTYCSFDVFSYIGLTISPTKEGQVEEDAGSGNKISCIYFYSTTCSTCSEISNYLDQLEQENDQLVIERFNVYEQDNLEYLYEYGQQFDLPKEEQGYTPSLFIGGDALIGMEIKKELSSLITTYESGVSTIQLNRQESTEQPTISYVVVIVAGMINGVSPCTLSMFLFLLSILTAKKEKMIYCGISFCIGKVTGFFILGVTCFQILSRISIEKYQNWFYGGLGAFAFIFAMLNLMDFIRAHHMEYDKMLLQLPSSIKRENHRVIRAAEGTKKELTRLILMAGVGMLLSAGEFLCSGQIYLASILLMIKNSKWSLEAISYLLVYSIAFVLPIAILLIVVSITERVFCLSDRLLQCIPWIKFLNLIVFVSYGIYAFYLMSSV